MFVYPVRGGLPSIARQCCSDCFNELFVFLDLVCYFTFNIFLCFVVYAPVYRIPTARPLWRIKKIY